MSAANRQRNDKMNETITILVNSFRETVPKNADISFLIRHFQEHDVDLIVEHNGRFVYSHQYDEITVSEGDRIEFLNPNIGG